MQSKPPAGPPGVKPPDERGKKALAAMAEIHNGMYRRMVEYVLTNQAQIRSESMGEDTYSYSLQQLDEQFLNKLNIVERALRELSRGEIKVGQMMTTTYQVVTIRGRREEIPQRIVEVLAENSSSELMDMLVMRSEESGSEIMLVMSREDPAPPGVQGKRKKIDPLGDDSEPV